MEFPEAALPALFHSANDLSVSMQRRFLRISALRLIFLVSAAVAGALTVKTRNGSDLAGFATALALVGAIVLEARLVREKPERAWYDGRVVAEAARTLAWRFGMGAHPFPRTLTTREAEQAFVAQLAEMLKSAPPMVLTARVGPVLDPSLQALRDAELRDRRDVYLRDRLADQAAWYAGKSAGNRKAASRWRTALVLTEAAGVTGALLRAVGAVDLDIAGIVAAVAGAGVAWLAVKKYEQLAQSYAYATNELAIVEGRISLATEEGTWATTVAEAEETISREHLAWRASRTTITN
ncbi:DUF4231 domain-containing protein [Amycolatopsis balhimycina DSM 5908]|uniref:DUF4231 domain-containing protein n=1 Tax=Amycolatopsis balhimycina DSM 5908 TaxID=1081091 RepID=A0A428WCD6_AMYBA|nr:DUF4231 domain-containing protein [Amycolatopsis balhimycina]RSM40760.1 DUF4231 domain-containing protein [Amycolatopsis balhimycina DSM 5908]